MGQLYLVRHSMSMCSLTISFIPHSLSRVHKSLTYRQTELGQTFCARVFSNSYFCSIFPFKSTQKPYTWANCTWSDILCPCVFWQLLLFHIVIPFQEHTKALNIGRLNLVWHSISVSVLWQLLLFHISFQEHIKALHMGQLYLVRHSVSVFSDNYFYSIFPFKSTQRTYTWADCTWTDASAGWSPALGCPRWWTSAPLSKRMLCLHRDFIHFEMNYEDKSCAFTEMWFTLERFPLKWIMKTNVVPA